MKSLKKYLGYLISPFALGLVVTFLMMTASVDYYANRNTLRKNDHSFAGLIQQAHEKTLDWRLVDRGQQQGSDRVAILAIDEAAIEQEGRWPWPRDKMAKLVERTIAAGAKVISFDIVYSEADQNSSISSLRKLKRALHSKQQLSTDADQAIESEIIATDGDRVFANTIKRHADRLVMGAYFDTADDNPAPHREFCQDALFERTYQSRYWKKEATPLTVVDSPLNKIQFPSALKVHLGEYFQLLEINKAVAWFEAHPELNPRIRENLDEWASLIPQEAYPGLATLWINNDLSNAVELLQQIKPDAANPKSAQALFSRFGSAFTSQEANLLTVEMRKAGIDYCADGFFNEKDELINFQTYAKVWGAKPDDPAIKEQFATNSMANIWKTIQNSRQPAGEQETLSDAIERIIADSLNNQVQPIERWWVSIPLLGDVTKHTGYFNAKQDTDGTIRKAMMFARQGNAYMPSLALKTFLVDKGYSALAKIDIEDVGQKEVSAKVAKTLEVIDKDGENVMRVPVDPHGHLMINYAGGRHMFPYIHAGDLLLDKETMKVTQRTRDMKNGKWFERTYEVNKKEFLKDKLLIVGATAIGVYDLRVTPFDENYPGVETHANVLSNLLVEHDRLQGERVPASAPGFMRSHPQEERLMWIVLLGLGLTLSLTLSYFGSVPGLGIMAVSMAGVYATDRYFLFGKGIVTTILFPQLQIFGTYVCLTFYKYFTEERKKRELKGTFEKYVSPSIVAEILSHPENVELGGKKMDLTVMFSDVRGFTTISEKLDPRELSNFLNSYLTPMTDLVFKNKGTLDKYMGDAVMAFWGAPIHFPDHAKHACRCALQMIEKLKELQKQYRAKGLPEIDIGIGLNSGEMSVGNMGSETVRSYTVMGDSVNLGSRLEGINKEYGTRIIISEFTQKAVADSFVTREVDWVRVKGKAQPVRIFELIREGKPSAQEAELISHFTKGFGLYHEKRFEEATSAFNDALKAQPDDAVSQLYVERCHDYLKEPPPENWDGVYTMTTK